MAIRSPATALVAVLLAASAAGAMPRFGDTVEAGGVEYLRDSEDAHLYHALPADPRLATDAGGKPRFSLMEFSFRGDDGAETAGALLNFMLTWGLDADGQAKAEQALREVDPEARIAGALTVREGRYRVLVIDGDERFVLAEGKASVLPGQPIAFSRKLEPAESKALNEALASEEGRVAAGFLLAVEGLGPRITQTFTIDWDGLGARTDLVALGAGAPPQPDASVRAAFDALRADGIVAIEGTPEASGLDEIYRRFRTEVFESVVDGGSSAGGGIDVHYVRREVAHTGRITVTIDGSRSERRDLFIAGDLTEAIRGSIEAAPEAVSTDP